MATPTRSQVASTPKNPVNTTPSRSNASPRTNLNAFGNKTIAGKSPAVKTPASLYGHAHKMSISSHPTSTPLATSTLPEDIMNINTPALLAMGAAGLTPLPTSVDGLGIATGVLNLPGPQDVHSSKNPERERHERLREVEDILRSRTAGRGITREHIQRLASINKFDADYTDDNTLSIAGERRVDLEILFDSRVKDTVKSVSLKLNMPDQDDAIYQKDASRVLESNLTSTLSDEFPWHNLSDFSANLTYLNHLEHVNTDANCFQVMDNLYDIFRQVWAEEKKRMKWRHDSHHLCKSNIGEPLKDANGRLGLSTNFWTKGSQFYAREEPKTENGKTPQQDWTASFAIGTGPPAMSVSQNWLGEDILTSTVRAEDIFQESAVDKPSWQDPVGKDLSAQNGNTMQLDQLGADPTESINMHLTCEIKPEIYLPLHVAQGLNEPSQILDLYHNQLSTFQQTLCPALDGFDLNPSLQRWTCSHYVPNGERQMEEQTYSYTLYATGPNVVHPVSKLNFAHPRQYSEALPALRQYALVNTLLRSVKPKGDTRKIDAPDTTNMKPIPIRGKIVKRSNKPQLDKDVQTLLGTHSSSQASPLTVDIRIDSTSSPIKSCRLEIRMPLSGEVLSRSAAAHLKAKHFMVIHIDILLNGVVEIISLDGIDMDKQRLEELKKRLARVVRASENIGIIVSWTLRELSNS